MCATVESRADYDCSVARSISEFPTPDRQKCAAKVTKRRAGRREAGKPSP
jgi:hypothetical protein